jgi:DNA uptake protein ComE-like DNA-binding protein
MIDITRPVKLLKMAVNRGNIYHPRIYNPGELPEEVLARLDIIQQDEVKEPVLTPTINNSDVKVENSISFSVEAPNTIPKTYPTETVVIGAVLPKTDVNKATIDELSKLPGVGAAIATKLDKARDQQPFTSVEDLDTRIPLRGKSWDELKESIVIQ